MAATKTDAISYSAFAWYNGGWNDWKTSATNGYIGYNSSLKPYYTVSCIRFKTPTFVGTSTNLSVKLKVRCSSYTSVKVYVSLSTSTPNGGTIYVGSTPGTDAGRVYSKIHTISGLTSTEAYKTISMDCDKLKSNTTYFLYISATTEQRLAEICSASSSTVSGTLTYDNPEYTVTYIDNAQGSTVYNMPSTQTKKYGTTLILSSNVPTHSPVLIDSNFNISCNGNGGKSKTIVATETITETRTFKGWNTKADGTGTVYAAGSQYNANAALTLYAQWNVTSTTQYSNNMPGTTTRDNETKTYTQTFAIAEHDEGKGYSLSKYSQNSSGLFKYTFTGWNSKADGTGTTNYSPTTALTAACTIYAQWKVEATYESIELPVNTTPPKTMPISISLYYNGGKFNNEEQSTITGTKLTPSWIVGWLDYPNKILLTSLDINCDEIKEFKKEFPSFTIIPIYEIPYSPKSSGTLNPIFRTDNENITGATLSLPTPVRPGYVLVGWSDTETGEMISASNYAPFEDDALTAVWAAYGGARIFNNGESANLYLPFIYTDGKFKQCLPYIYTDGAWRLCGG